MTGIPGNVLKRVVAGAAARGLVFVLGLMYFVPVCLPAGVPAQDTLNKGNYFSPERIEEELLNSLNRERTSRGLKALISHPLLLSASLAHCRKMADENTLSHDFPNYKTLSQRLGDLHIPFLACGENVAFSQSIIGDRIHQGFMNSEGHRRNILNPDFTHIGLRAVRTGDDFYVTQTFARLYEPISALEMEIFLEKELTRSFHRNDERSLVFYPKIRPFARMTARFKAEGKPLESLLNSLPSTWGKMDVVNIVTADKDILLADLEKSISAKQYQGAGLGAAFLRNDHHPGGAYSVSLFMALPMPVKSGTGEFRQQILAAINARRVKEGKPPLTLNTEASLAGSRISAFQVFGLEREPNNTEQEALKLAMAKLGFRKASFLSFKTADANDIPNNVLEQINARLNRPEETTQLAILVFHTAVIDSPEAYFLVVIVF